MQKQSILIIVVLGSFLLIGLAIMGGSVYFGWRTMEKVNNVASWPTVPAYIIESSIDWTVQASGHSGRRSHSYYFLLSVQAYYRIDGHYFTCSTPAIKPIREYKFIRDPKKNPPNYDMVALFKQVPPGGVVPIHYNPENPEEAYLFSDLPSWKLFTLNGIAFLLGLISCLFGLVLWLAIMKFRTILKVSPIQEKPSTSRLSI